MFPFKVLLGIVGRDLNFVKKENYSMVHWVKYG
jgi:hypothetical protein